MGFLKGIKIDTFMDTYGEWHAFVNGFCEVLCPWPPRRLISEELQQQIASEYHYYVFGRVIGVIAWLIILPITIGIIGKIIQEVFF
jgi:hypothetical protein